jgi:Protein of unknown function (DUF2884)
MKHWIFFAAAMSVMASPVSAHSKDCNFSSEYKFSQQGRTLIFSRDQAPGKRIMIQDARMVIDGQEQKLSAQDKQRVAEFESEMRSLIPQVKQVSLEAVDIAFTALVEVSHALSGDQNNETVKKLLKSQVQLRQSIAKDPGIVINGDIDAEIIAPVITDFVPDIVSGAVKQALSLAFSGDDKKAAAFEARMDKMGADIDSKVAARAKKLEPLAEAMCQRVQAMDRIEDSLSIRLADKNKINLLDTKAP